MKNNFTGTGKLVGFILRRERWTSTLWILFLSAFSVVLAPMLAQMFDAPAREALILTIDNPAMIAILGPIYGREQYTEGAMYFNMMIQWVMIAAAIMNILLVVRHTRTEEERGRIDMLRALPTGMFSGLGAVIITAAAVNLLVMVLTGAGIALCGVAHMGWNGSMLYGAAIGAVGFVFAAITAMCAQIFTTSRGTTGISIVLLGFFYLLRGAGDIGNEVLSYISPLGLAQRTQAYVENYWTPILLLLAEAAILFAAAFVLSSRRDIRQGFLPERRGAEHAGKALCSPFGLAFRLLRMPFWGWVIGMFVIGASYGSILGTIDTFVQSSEVYSLIIGARPEFSAAQMFVSMVTALMALCAAASVLMMIGRLRGEEKDGYSLQVLSRAVSRQTYMAGYVLAALLMSIFVQGASALGIYASAAAVLPDKGALPLGYLMKANLVYLPALWVMLGCMVLMIGAFPKLTVVVWIYFAFSFIVTFLGRLPDVVPEWVCRLTPYGYIPNLPADEIEIVPLVVLTCIAGILILAGGIAYRKRDMMAS